MTSYQGVLTPGEQAREARICVVKPEAPSESYLIKKLEGSGITGDRMPKGFASGVSPEDLRLFRQWIQEGARNN